MLNVGVVLPSENISEQCRLVSKLQQETKVWLSMFG